MDDSDEGTGQSRFSRRSRRRFVQSAGALGLGLTTGTSIAAALENGGEHGADNGDADGSNDGGTIEIGYRRCRVALVTNVSDVDALAAYYADGEDDRMAVYDIDPTTTDSREHDPLVVTHDATEDQTRVELAGSEGSLVCIVAETDGERITRVNPTDACVPAGFNSGPSAGFRASSRSPTIGETVTLTSTATDPDDPERLRYEWDLDGDGNFETAGRRATITVTEAGGVAVGHRVTDDCGAVSSSGR